MEGDESLQQFSPEILIEDPSAKNAVPLLPHIVLFHGTADFSIPPDARFENLPLLRKLLPSDNNVCGEFASRKHWKIPIN